ncbi:hypothetical protein GF354_05230 [Candidatus Peregrinibacteria bacterium]|nr:hypothetical protein [Candidatus Peregrinibacteria bacterium]
MHRIRKNIFYIVVGVAAIIMGSIYQPVISPNEGKREAYNILETSMLSILKNITDNVENKAPDLSIEKVVLKKLADPTETYNFYKYNASILLKNYGGPVKKASVVLKSGKDSIMLKNDGTAFTLDSNESFTIRNFEFEFDGRYNGGEKELDLEILDYDLPEMTLENNSYKLEIFEENPKIKNLSIKDITEDGAFVLEFDDNNFSFTTNTLEVYFAKNLNIAQDDYIYSESFIGGELYPYFRIKNSKEILTEVEWLKTETEGIEDPIVRVYEDPYEIDTQYFVYLRSVNKNSGKYKISDVLTFKDVNDINRAQFAKFFIDYADLSGTEPGLIHYEDIDFGEWYAPAVQTIYDLGLTDMDSFTFRPSDFISRAEALKTVMDYFDADLVYDYMPPRFEDVSEGHEYYPYIQALALNSYSNYLADSFSPDQNTTKEFLRFIINAYKESN